MDGASDAMELDLAEINNVTAGTSIVLKAAGNLTAIQRPTVMKPSVVADEMFPEGAGAYMDVEEAGGSTALLMDLAANEKSVHADFFNDFDDLFDDEDVN